MNADIKLPTISFNVVNILVYFTTLSMSSSFLH